MGMIFGVAYVVSGLVVTIAGRRSWRLRREHRQTRARKTEPALDAADAAEDTEGETPQGG
jgi:hypothetical protein